MSHAPTQQQLEQACREWQQRLRLQDWRVKVELVNRYDLPGVCARVNKDAEYKLARVQIGRPEHYEDCDDIAKDWEHTLVHELLHLHLDAWEPASEMERTAQEQAINLMAEALVMLAREGE